MQVNRRDGQDSRLPCPLPKWGSTPVQDVEPRGEVQAAWSCSNNEECFGRREGADPPQVVATAKSRLVGRGEVSTSPAVQIGPSAPCSVSALLPVLSHTSNYGSHPAHGPIKRVSAFPLLPKPRGSSPSRRPPTNAMNELVLYVLVALGFVSVAGLLAWQVSRGDDRETSVEREG